MLKFWRNFPLMSTVEYSSRAQVHVMGYLTSFHSRIIFTAVAIAGDVCSSYTGLLWCCFVLCLSFANTAPTCFKLDDNSMPIVAIKNNVRVDFALSPGLSFTIRTFFISDSPVCSARPTVHRFSAYNSRLHAWLRVSSKNDILQTGDACRCRQTSSRQFPQLDS